MTQLIQNFPKLICPEIVGDDWPFIKEVLTLQIFTAPRYNEKLHILLVGEPASGKTDALLDVAGIVPNSSYSGSNLTRVGLLEKLSYSDGGILAFDEADKLGHDVRIGLLEAMQTGTVTIDKFRMHRQVQARVNVLMAMNPIGERFTWVPLMNQIILTPAEISRFHLIICCYPPEMDLYPDIAIRMGIKNNRNETRRKKMMELLIRVNQEVKEVSVSQKIRTRIGDRIRTLKQMSNMRDYISPRLIDGAISMTKARARMDIRSEAVRDDFDWVDKNVLERIYVY